MRLNYSNQNLCRCICKFFWCLVGRSLIYYIDLLITVDDHTSIKYKSKYKYKINDRKWVKQINLLYTITDIISILYQLKIVSIVSYFFGKTKLLLLKYTIEHFI